MVIRSEAAFGLLSDYGNRIFLNELNGLEVGEGMLFNPTTQDIIISGKENELEIVA